MNVLLATIHLGFTGWIFLLIVSLLLVGFLVIQVILPLIQITLALFYDPPRPKKVRQPLTRISHLLIDVDDGNVEDCAECHLEIMDLCRQENVALESLYPGGEVKLLKELSEIEAFKIISFKSKSQNKTGGLLKRACQNILRWEKTFKAQRSLHYLQKRLYDNCLAR